MSSIETVIKKDNKEKSIQFAEHVTIEKKPKAESNKSLRKRNLLKVNFRDIDVTPVSLKPLKQFNMVQITDDANADDSLLSQIDFSLFGSMKSAGHLQSQLHSQSINFAQTYATMNTSMVKGENELWDFWRIGSLLQSVCEPPEYNLEEGISYAVVSDMANRAIIILNETPIFYLLELASLTAEKDTDEGSLVEKDNAYYEYLTVGKGRNRKTTNAEVQTATGLRKTRYTLAERQRTRDNHAFASKWDMFDTFENIVSERRKTNINHGTVLPVEEQEYQMQQLMKKANFHNCVVIMERMLDNNVYNKEQKRFRGLIRPDPFRLDIHFRYTLDLLWTFKNTSTAKHPVTSMDWNPFNSDVLAVGYGKFLYSQHKHGFVYCWNIKNPSQPEREYYYTEPVTAVLFSKFKPTLIAVGLYDGTVTILDISTRDVSLLYTTYAKSALSHDPIWQLMWLPPDQYSPDNEYLAYTCEDGFVCRLMISRTNELTPYKLMKPPLAETAIKGISQNTICTSSDVPTSVSPAVLSIAQHLVDKDLYYIGTDDGAVHKCSMNNVNEHLDVFLAHNGPVYSCEFSPFCNKLLLTAGADWCINIWAEGIKEPLLSLTSPMNAIEGAVWSPSNATIIASVAGDAIHLWDIQRKTYAPCSVHKSPTNCRNTMVQFTASGRNLVVGDIEGNVHIFSLEDMPFPQFYPAEILTQVIKKALITRKEILNELDNLKSLKY